MKKREKSKSPRHFWVNVRRALALAVPTAILLMALCGLSMIAYAGKILLQIDPEVLREPIRILCDEAKPSEIYYMEYTNREERAGIEKLLDSIGFSYNPYAKSEEIADSAKEAAVAIEDKRFYRHHGVDWLRTGKAAINRLLGGNRVFGGSTITQQLVKNLTGDNDRTVARKLREMVLSAQMEAIYSKEEILELYLNAVCFGNGVTGIGEAAKTYYRKSASELTPTESATLLAIINSPVALDPVRHPQANRRRRDHILACMEEQGYLSAQEGIAARLQPEGTPNFSKNTACDEVHGWYTDMVVQDVLRDLQAVGYAPGEALNLLYRGGLHIVAAMDGEIQKTAETYYQNPGKFPPGCQSAMMMVDPHTGDILAVVGATGEKSANRVLNFATDARHSPGSSIKPLSVYAPAFERGLITFGTVVDDTPFRFEGQALRPWPHNADCVYRGLTDLPTALAHSTNTVAVKLLDRLGVEESYRFLTNSLGFRNVISEGRTPDGRTISDLDFAALALGQMNYGVTLREMVGGYTALADGGLYHAPHSYMVVTDRKGRVLLQNTGDGRPALSEQNAYLVTKLLQGVTAVGTAKRLTLTGATAVAGKTGTTTANADKWFIGYTPQLLCGVWCGETTPGTGIHGNPCIAAFDAIMTKSLTPSSAKEFAVPPEIVRVKYCADSGFLPTAACALDPRGCRERVGYFVKGTEPVCGCHRHVRYRVQGEDGGVVAQDETGGASLLQVARRFPREVVIADAQYVCPETNAESSNFHCGISAVCKPYNRRAIPEEAMFPWLYGRSGLSQTETEAQTETDFAYSDPLD